MKPIFLCKTLCFSDLVATDAILLFAAKSHRLKETQRTDNL
jgi:hypothetical protein